jgi:hypothetical protein
MPFPNSPIDGQQAVVNGITYTYSSAKTAWQRASSTANSLVISSNITAGNISTSGRIDAGPVAASGYFWANGAALAIATSSLTNGTSNISVGVSGNITVGVGGTANVSVFSPLGITAPNVAVTGNITTVGNIVIGTGTGALITGVSSITANAAVVSGGYIDNTSIGATTANTGRFTSVTVTSGTSSTTTGTGAIIITGGIGVSGNVYASGVYIGSGSATNGLFWSANRAAVSTGGGSFSGGVVSGVPYFSSNIVANSGTASTSTTTGAIVVTGSGGVGVGGDINAGGNLVLGSGTSGLITGVNSITSVLGVFTGNSLSASMSSVNMLEKVTVLASALSGVYNFDCLTQSIIYISANTTVNFTINFRGSSSTSLDTAMAVGQSISVVMLVTNGATAYYPDVYQVDGNAVTPKWQGGTAPTSGNASAIDVYSYSIIKTASATFTVLASQTKFA